MVVLKLFNLHGYMNSITFTCSVKSISVIMEQLSWYVDIYTLLFDVIRSNEQKFLPTAWI